MNKLYKYLFLDDTKGLSLFAYLLVIFYVMSYISIGSIIPNAIPIHHDDYSNYARILSITDLSLIRPLSTFVIQVLSDIHPEFLIYGVRVLTVSYVFLVFYIVTEIFQVKINLIYKLLISIAIFSTPISVEYARYTGMITHLISGNLAFVSIILLNKGMRDSKYYIIILSSISYLLSKKF